MTDEALFHRGTTFVRRLRLAPGEAMPWHRDPFHRVTVSCAAMPSLSNTAMGGRAIASRLTPGKLVGTSRPTAFTAVSMLVSNPMRKSPSSFLTVRTWCLSRMRNSQRLRGYPHEAQSLAPPWHCW